MHPLSLSGSLPRFFRALCVFSCLLFLLPASLRAAQRLTAPGKSSVAAPARAITPTAKARAQPAKTAASKSGKANVAGKSAGKPAKAAVVKAPKAPASKGKAVAKAAPASAAKKRNVAAAPKNAKNRAVQRAREVARKAAPVWRPDETMTPLDIELQLTSKAYMVMDAGTGAAIVSKNPDEPRQPASTIKIVTGLIALTTLADTDVVPVSPHAAGMPSSKVYIQTSRTYSADDMINSVLLASANDASVALAERIAGSEERFAQIMTYNARRWGATNTVCRTASGLTADGQQSTARDLAQLFRVAMRNSEFARRMHARTAGTAFGKTLKNHNKALWQLDGAVAGKTGYTNAARQTYVGQFARDGHSIVVAIMGSETMWTDLGKLVDYGFQQKRLEMAGLRGRNSL